MEEALVDKSPIPLKDYQGLHVEIDEEKNNPVWIYMPKWLFFYTIFKFSQRLKHTTSLFDILEWFEMKRRWIKHA